MATTVGRFTLHDSGSIEGPADYLDAPDGLDECLRRIERGESAVVNYAPEGVPLERLILVAVQTHYAGWKGTRDMLRAVGG